jgi:hypothetical protein
LIGKGFVLNWVGVTPLTQFEPDVFERALSFRRFLKRFSASGRSDSQALHFRAAVDAAFSF